MLEQPKYAQQISGQSRARWYWRGKAYTAHGVEVPESVRIGDEELWEAGKETGTDEQVLDMKVTLPKEALPPGFELSAIENQPATKHVTDERVKEKAPEPVAPAPPLEPQMPVPAVAVAPDAGPMPPSLTPEPVVSEAVAQQRAARGQK
jgi:hypothetical protein